MHIRAAPGSPSIGPIHKLKRAALALLLVLAIGNVAAAQSKVYVSSQGAQLIARMNLDGSNVEDLVTGESVRAIDVDPIGRKIYWLVPSGGGGLHAMRRSDLDGTNAETIWPDLDTYIQFRIDHHNAKIYYSKNAADRIWRANLDGSGHEALVRFTDADPQVSPEALAIDIRNDRLYWTNSNGPASVQYTNLAGTDPVVSVPVSGALPMSGIDVDPVGGKLYWKDGAGIWSADLDVGNQILLVPPPDGQGFDANNDLRLDHDNGDLYWTQSSVAKIWRCELAGCTPQQIGTLTTVSSLALLLPCYDPFRIDSDSDGAFDLCDNCLLEINAGQGDLDSDGEGDVCDLDDGQITVWFGAPAGPDDVLRWDSEFGPFWNAYRSDLDTIETTGVYTQAPGSHPAADRFCNLMSPIHQDGHAPLGGEVAAFLVTGYDNGLETDLGTPAAPRPNHNPCP